MEPIFTNICTYTKETLRDALFTQRRNQRIASFITILVLAGLTAIEAGILQMVYLYYVTIVLALLAVMTFAYVPLMGARTTYKRNLELFHTDIVATTLFFDDRFESITQPSKAELTINYDQIRRVESSRSLYVLVLKRNLLIILDKSTFEQNDPAAFELFLREKAPKAKFRL